MTQPTSSARGPHAPDATAPASPAGTVRSGAVPRLAARGLVHRFGDTTALAGVDVDLTDGGSLAVMGPSGSGKSTLLHVLAGILVPTAGTVHLRGTPVQGLSERERSLLRRRSYGFVFQHGQLLSELSARENVALPAMLLGTPRAEAEAAADRWLAQLGLAGAEGRRPGELSGGQAQRVAVARALATHPDVVFADEPTGALDQATGHDVMKLLVETTREVGASLVVVTHDADVAAWCDRRIDMRDGLVVAPGSTPSGGAGPRPGEGPAAARRLPEDLGSARVADVFGGPR
ncbi:ABC transporter related protein [Cellulomonas flavigena DSM 20109]|uniref:ABC transporter related protein n=1 Tax=Cellulomonas flavigena (strain ATCC 482 / DSM 20109 / BCRC 11376 / JCM 18109 / NBRC 3775 / NCIMB 8073 / NRS 134) TaxID=446466 RepID=D5ULQ3_CELFN|nr:ABC transporter ATP-binding protein [Cellulomonas flavigena]ADG76009.1 ABC transporter related protein [Cellulomonas flavigena DSM 20109]